MASVALSEAEKVYIVHGVQVAVAAAGAGRGAWGGYVAKTDIQSLSVA